MYNDANHSSSLFGLHTYAAVHGATLETEILPDNKRTHLTSYTINHAAGVHMETPEYFEVFITRNIQNSDGKGLISPMFEGHFNQLSIKLTNTEVCDSQSKANHYEKTQYAKEILLNPLQTSFYSDFPKTSDVQISLDKLRFFKSS